MEVGSGCGPSSEGNRARALLLLRTTHLRLVSARTWGDGPRLSLFRAGRRAGPSFGASSPHARMGPAYSAAAIERRKMDPSSIGAGSRGVGDPLSSGASLYERRRL